MSADFVQLINEKLLIDATFKGVADHYGTTITSVASSIEDEGVASTTTISDESDLDGYWKGYIVGTKPGSVVVKLVATTPLPLEPHGYITVEFIAPPDAGS
ncbi:MAG: hypothetical protein AAF542_17910 [Pseudomonadota bacterium]